jgi:SWI/SNF-related matrix-associated actin-dependent regulator of chromatin subfamily A3
MTGHPGKRKSDAGSSDAPRFDVPESRASKLRKLIRPDPPATTTGQRFGETVQYIPTEGTIIPAESTDRIPLSQVAGADEDDAQAEDLIQGSQVADESSVSSATLYGMSLPHSSF